MAWKDARDPASNRLLFQIDPERRLIEAMCIYWDGEQRKRVRYPVVIDLAQSFPELFGSSGPDTTPSATPDA